MVGQLDEIAAKTGAARWGGEEAQQHRGAASLGAGDEDELAGGVRTVGSRHEHPAGWPAQKWRWPPHAAFCRKPSTLLPACGKGGGKAFSAPARDRPKPARRLPLRQPAKA